MSKTHARECSRPGWSRPILVIAIAGLVVGGDLLTREGQAQGQMR